LACWAVTGIVWAVGAVRSHPNPRPAAAEPRDTASLAAAGAAVAALLTPQWLWAPLTLHSPWPRIAGAAVLVVATAAVVWARTALGAMWSSRAIVAERHELRTDGPYRLSRHPIYTTILAMLAATALTQGVGRWAAVLVAVAVALVSKTRSEERLLLREFPIDYRRYQSEVPRLLPSRRLRRPASR
jgi:protein-S-isoprenylcysteine O-methyltransferase Ste14